MEGHRLTINFCAMREKLTICLQIYHNTGQLTMEVRGATFSSQPNPALYPRLPMAPAQKLAALHSLLTELEQKLRQLPEDFMASKLQTGKSELNRNAAYMAKVYLQGQREIAELSIKVFIITFHYKCQSAGACQHYIGVTIKSCSKKHLWNAE